MIKIGEEKIWRRNIFNFILEKSTNEQSAHVTSKAVQNEIVKWKQFIK